MAPTPHGKDRAGSGTIQRAEGSPTLPTLTLTLLGATLGHAVLTRLRHFSWDMKLHTAGVESMSWPGPAGGPSAQRQG